MPPCEKDIGYRKYNIRSEPYLSVSGFIYSMGDLFAKEGSEVQDSKMFSRNRLPDGFLDFFTKYKISYFNGSIQ